MKGVGFGILNPKGKTMSANDIDELKCKTASTKLGLMLGFDGWLDLLGLLPDEHYDADDATQRRNFETMLAAAEDGELRPARLVERLEMLDDGGA